MIAAVVTRIHFTDTLANYSDYQQLLNVAIGSILGFIVIMTMFYLGKFHDYKKDFIVIKSKIKSSQTLHKTKLDQLKQLQIETDQIQSSNTHIKTDIQLSKSIDNLLKSNDNVEKSSGVIIDIEEIIFSGIKPIEKFILLISLFTTTLFFINLTDNSTEGSLYSFFCLICIGVINLLVIWIMYERNMKMLHKIYSVALEVKADTELSIKYTTEYISMFNTIIKNLMDIHRRLQALNQDEFELFSSKYA